MKRVAALLVVLGLAACGAETGSNDEACREVDAVAVEIREFAEPLTDEQADSARQWEFRLAEASVLATDHDLAASIRDLADAAGNVAEDLDDARARDTFESIHADVAAKCN
ncbi:hypothetical protein [Flaviflexus huanghaiensis]|uniref:hypothetical protein n=1 Tax=Flaviflexus huanghaiensis TaxID=1111473 RepID=UPI0015FB497F|nr:hypothetical protein [Flaviflexus huanghaiensis]